MIRSRQRESARHRKGLVFVMSNNTLDVETRREEEEEYVEKVGYDAWGQRVYMKLGNGVETTYTYDKDRRWLDTIHTMSGNTVLQNIQYCFDDVGNVSGYTNRAETYKTEQSYGYDGLYQLTSADGYTEQYQDYRAEYHQTFTFDDTGLGNMTKKTSHTVKSDKRIIGDDLDYTLDYVYDGDYVHRAAKIGNRYYEYDENGNVILEQGGEIVKNDTGITYTVTNLGNDTHVADYGWGIDHKGGVVTEEKG